MIMKRVGQFVDRLVFCAISSQLIIAQTVGPLIKTQWNQNDPYNLMCPEIDGKHCLTSCGATADAP